MPLSNGAIGGCRGNPRAQRILQRRVVPVLSRFRGPHTPPTRCHPLGGSVEQGEHDTCHPRSSLPSSSAAGTPPARSHESAGGGCGSGPELPPQTLVNRPSHPLERADRQNPDPRSQSLGPNRRALEHAADSFRIDVSVVGLIPNRAVRALGRYPASTSITTAILTPNHAPHLSCVSCSKGYAAAPAPDCFSAGLGPDPLRRTNC
jgi:hypothetical protein